MPVARDSFPSFAIAHEIALLHAGNCSGRCPQRQTAGFAVSLVEQFMPARDLRSDVSRRGSADCSPRRKRTANVENLRNIDVKQWRSLCQFRDRNLIERRFRLTRMRDKCADVLVPPSTTRLLLDERLRKGGCEKSGIVCCGFPASRMELCCR